jgi:pyruvate-ferredoxin/flavodoxin oxidoreductase
MTLPMTFADFAATEARFLKHFRKAPPETWNESMVPVAEFLELDLDEREGKFPFIWAVDKKNRLMRLLVTKELIKSAEERLHFWRQLRGLAGAGAEAADAAEVEGRVREELLAKISAALGQGGSVAAAGGETRVGAGDTATAKADCGGCRSAGGDYEPVWIESPECTACDECTTSGAEGLRLQRAEAGRGDQSEGRQVRRHRQGRREMHCRLHPSRHALEHERAGHREADGARGEVQLKTD